MTTVQVLKKARALLARRNGWCQGSYVRERNGKEQFCSVGAIIRIAGHTKYSQVAARSALEALVPRGLLIRFNDTRGRKKTHILRLFDRAIKAAQS